MKTAFQKSAPRRLPKVVIIQWALAVFALLVAISSYLVHTYDGLVMLTPVLVLASLSLAVQMAAEMIVTRLPGKFILLASTFFYFWIGAIDIARQDVPFSVPSGLPFPARQFDIEFIQLAFVYIALFQIALLIGYSIQPHVPRLIRVASSRFDSRSHNAHALRYVLAACALVPILLSYNLDIWTTIQVLIASRGETSSEAKDIGLVHFLLFFGMFGAALFLVEAVVLRSIGKIRDLFIGIITVLPFILSGTRHLWLFISFPACMLLFRRLRGKLTITRVLRWAVVVFVIILVMQFQYVLRTTGWEDVRAVSSQDLTQAEVTGQFTALLYAEYLVPGTHEYFMEPAETYFIIHWIPRKFWPDKPIMQSWSYYNDSYTQGGAFNVTPSVIGQFHLNWGIYGVIFIGIWLGILASIADRMLLNINLEKQHAMAVVIGMFYTFIISSFRFYSPIYFAYLLFAIIAMWFVTHRSLESGGMIQEPSLAATHPRPLASRV